MKRFFKRITQYSLACLLIWSASSSSLAITQVGLPSGICTNSYYQCDETAEKRWSLFKSSDGIENRHDDILSVGSCSKNGVSNDEVFVLLALSHQLNKVHFDAKISFHNDLSDYQDIPVSELHQVFPQITFNKNVMSSSESHAYIDYTQFSPFRYWLRYNPDENKFMMVAYFGFVDTFVCEFQTV